jgi:hypothetical protein
VGWFESHAVTLEKFELALTLFILFCQVAALWLAHRRPDASHLRLAKLMSALLGMILVSSALGLGQAYSVNRPGEVSWILLQVVVLFLALLAGIAMTVVARRAAKEPMNRQESDT